MADRVIALAGLRTRPATTDDVDAITELIAACERHDDGEVEIDREDVEMGFGRNGFEPEADTLLAFDGDGLVAWGDVYQDRAEADVRPDRRSLGIGAALIAWTEQRALAHDETKVSQTVTDANHGAAELFASQGYEPSRTAWILQIELDPASPPEPTVPEGISVRAYDPARDDRAAYRVIDDAFSEWPGREPIPFEEWAPFVIGHGAFSPARSPLAFDGDELVGVVLSFDYGAGDGWIHQLATKASHRHRGIARALLQTAFRGFAELGRRRAGLSTDSRTGALSLYERVGMSVHRSYTRYTKEL